MYDFFCNMDYMNLPENEKENRYRENMCKAFYMESYSDDIVKQVIDYLYEYTKYDEFFIHMKKLVMEKHNYANELINDDQMFITFFAYDYYDIFHLCLKDKHINSIVSDELKNKFIERLK